MGLWKPGTWAKELPVRADSWAEAPLQGPEAERSSQGARARGSAGEAWRSGLLGQGSFPTSPAALLEGKLLWGEGER